MVDVAGILYGVESQVYADIGVPGVFAAFGTVGEVAITVIDDTRPKSMMTGVGGARAVLASSAEVRSVARGAFVRIPELEANGIARADYIDAKLSFNGRSWIVINYELRGSPAGEDMGEVRFLLKAAAS